MSESRLVSRLAKAPFLKSKFSRNVFVLSAGTSAAQVVVLLATPVLTRLYTPDDFGVLAIYSGLLAILTVAIGGRFELAIPLPKRTVDGVNLVALSLLLVVSSSFLVACLVAVAASEIASLLNSPILAAYLWLLPIGLILSGSYQTFSHWAIRTTSYSDLAKTRLTQGVGSVIVQLGIGLLRAGPLGLILGQIVGQSAGTLKLAAAFTSAGRRPVRSVSPVHMKRLAHRYRKFPTFSMPGSLANAAGLQLPAILMAVVYGPAAAGWYLLAYKVTAIPMRLIGTAVSQVFYGEMPVGMREQGGGILYSRFMDTGKKLLYVGIIPVLVLIALGPYLFKTIFGSEWHFAGVYVQGMGFMLLAQFSVTPTAQPTLNLLERQEINMAWDILRVAVVLVLFSIAAIFHLSDVATVYILSFSMMLCYLLLWFLALRSAKMGSEPHE